MATFHHGKRLKEMSQMKGYRSARQLALAMGVTAQKVARDFKMEDLSFDIMEKYLDILGIEYKELSSMQDSIETQQNPIERDLLKELSEANRKEITYLKEILKDKEKIIATLEDRINDLEERKKELKTEKEVKSHPITVS